MCSKPIIVSSFPIPMPSLVMRMGLSPGLGKARPAGHQEKAVLPNEKQQAGDTLSGFHKASSLLPV